MRAMMKTLSPAIINSKYIKLSLILIIMSTKISLKFILTSDPKQPFKTVQAPEETPFVILVKQVSQLFNIDPETTGITTKTGSGVNMNQIVGDVFLKYGDEFLIIPRD